MKEQEIKGEQTNRHYFGPGQQQIVPVGTRELTVQRLLPYLLSQLPCHEPGS